MSEYKLKFMHAADIHLDSAFAEFESDKAALRRSELRASFTALITFARVNNVELMLIAGDLFDDSLATRETAAHIRREFASCPNTRFVISPGNHDPFNAASFYSQALLPENVYVFNQKELSYIEFDDINTTVYGYAFTSGEYTENPLRGFSVPDDGRIHLFCAHCDLDVPSSKYCPITTADILNAKFDYAALGHIHNTEGINYENGLYFGYSGCLEGRDFGECGYKGAVICDAVKQDGIFSADVKGLRFSRRRYERLNLDLTGIKDEESAYTQILQSVKGVYSNDTSLRLTLLGDVPSDLALSQTYIRELIGETVFSLELIDKTLPLADTETLKTDPSIKGAFYRELESSLSSDDEGEKELAAEALRYGLAAIAGREF